jgi:hypothetical protein
MFQQLLSKESTQRVMHPRLFVKVRKAKKDLILLEPGSRGCKLNQHPVMIA